MNKEGSVKWFDTEEEAFKYLKDKVEKRKQLGRGMIIWGRILWGIAAVLGYYGGTFLHPLPISLTVIGILMTVGGYKAIK